MRVRTGVAALALVCPLVIGGCALFDGEPDAPQGAPTTPGATSSGDGSSTGDSSDGSTNGSSDGSSGGTATDDALSGQETASAAPTSTDGPQRPVEVTITAMGDILAHSRVNVTANRYAGGGEGQFDYGPMFEDVTEALSSGDLTLCHLETPLSPDNTNLSAPDVLVFNTPFQMATALAEAGVDGCDFASNHTMDHGLSGLEATEQVVRDAGMGYAGPTAHEELSGKPQVHQLQTADGSTATVAHLAYTYTYPNSGGPTTNIPGEAPWLVDASWPTIGSEGILEQAEAAKDDGADFVVVSMHWGTEYQAAPHPDQTRIAHELLESDAVDLILGTHVHVIQPCEQVNGKHVLYGMGNFLSNQSPVAAAGLLPETQEGMIAHVTLTRDEAGEVSSEMTYRPTRVQIDPEALAAGSTGPHIVRLVSPETHPETWDRTTSTVDSLGGCGATPVQP
ncbi:CapA family protein [Ornithinimicrobium panacihumi]|uniref:CapA family protein n=1 Tax=Ornithinimicrobium panacihumi TaxID=2008449 RepID=UPI003F8CB621